jgi:WD40 repeat protein/serine/threonine protein kinase
MPAAPVQTGEVLNGKYRVEEVVGSGGMGVVVAAVHVQLGSRVALKFMLPDGAADPETVERFSREARAAVQLRSEHVARIIDVDELHDGRPYIVMEYLEGTDLAAALQAEKTLPVPTAADYVIQAMDALAEAHARGIVHRDLKPRNLFLARRADGSALVKVLDFGISKVVPAVGAPSLTQTQSLIGSPAYMSPEQLWSSKLADVRSDIWSLGVILYELVSGHVPFGATTFSTQILKVVLETLPPIDAQQPVPDEFEVVVQRCLAKDPAHRFGNVAQLASALEPLAPPSVRPIVERIHKIVNESTPASAPSAAPLPAALARTPLLGTTATLPTARFAHEPDPRGVSLPRRGHKWKLVWLGAALAVVGGGAAGLYGTSREAHDRLLRLHVEQGRAAVLAGDALRGLAYLGEAYRDGARGPAVDVLLGSAARALGGERLVLHDPGRVIGMPEFSPDGRRILVSGDDGVSQIRDAADGALLTSIRGTGRRGWIHRSAFSPDSSRIAVRRAGDRAVEVRDAGTGDLVHRLEGHSDEVVDVSFSPDGRRILTASRDASVRIWSAESGEQLHRLSGAKSIASAVWRPGGTQIAAGTADGAHLIWDASTGRLVGSWKGHERSVSVRFSPDGTRLATASWDGKVRIWDPDAGVPLVTLPNGSATSVAIFFPDGRRLVSTGSLVAKVWDVKTGALLYMLEGHTGSVFMAQVSGDGTRILTTGGDETARLWDARNGELLWTYLGARWSASLDSAGRRVIAALTDGTARVWDAHRTPYDRVLRGHGGSVSSARFSPDGARILTASSADRTIKLWDAATGRELASTSPEPSKQGSVSWSPDGARFLTVEDRTAKIWDVRTMRPVLRLVGHTAPLWPNGRAGFSPDGRKVVTASEDRTARIWDAMTGRELARLEGHRDTVYSAEFSPDGAAVVTASEDGAARVWSAASGRVLKTLEGHAEGVVSATFDRTGSRVLTTSGDRTAKIWDARTGALLSSLDGHTHQVNRSDFHPSGALVVTSSIDGTARLWDSRDGRLLGNIAKQPWIGEATFSPDGTRVLTASTDGTARIWHVPVVRWTTDELTRFLRCRVPFQAEDGRLRAARIDPGLCQKP